MKIAVLRAGRRLSVRPWTSDALLLATLTLAALLAGTYLLFLKSPLRLAASDETVYLSLAASMVDGERFVEAPILYPPGYPALLAGLELAGLGIPWALVALNLLFLAVALVAVYVISTAVLGLGARWAALVGCLVLLSRPVVWGATTALSDLPFLGVAMTYLVVLLVARRRSGRKAWLLLALAGALTAAAIEIRSVGIALVPPLLFAALAQPSIRRRARRLRDRPLIAVSAAGALLGALAFAAIVAVRDTGYLGATADGWRGEVRENGVAGAVAEYVREKLATLGDLAVNVPRTHAPGALDAAYVAVGVLVLVLVAAAIWSRRKRFDVPDLFVLSTAAALVAWPGNLTRLWVPILPLLLAYGALVARAHVRLRAVRIAVALYVAGFAVAGVVILGYNARIALSGSSFPSVWGKEAPDLEATYRFAFTGTPPPRGAGEIDVPVLRLLRRYEPRAARVGREAEATKPVRARTMPPPTGHEP